MCIVNNQIRLVAITAKTDFDLDKLIHTWNLGKYRGVPKILGISRFVVS